MIVKKSYINDLFSYKYDYHCRTGEVYLISKLIMHVKRREEKRRDDERTKHEPLGVES